MKTENSYEIKKLNFFYVFRVWSMYKNSSEKVKSTFILARNFRNFFLRFIFKRTYGFMCLDGKEVVGFVFLFFLRARDVKTLGIMVKEGHQGKGIGKKLIYVMLKNHDKVRLEVIRANEKAVNLYKSCGFKENDGTMEMLYEVGI